MKKSIYTLILVFAFSGIFGKTNNSEITDFVITENGVSYFTKVRTGVNNNIIGITEAGEKVNFDKSKVKAFRKKGREYKRLYLVDEGSNYVKSVFLEKLLTRSGYSLYKKINFGDEKLSLNSFYVYHNDQLELQLDKENYKVVLSFFFPRFNSMFAK